VIPDPPAIMRRWGVRVGLKSAKHHRRGELDTRVDEFSLGPLDSYFLSDTQ